MKRLIAILDNPCANPPGHTIKEAQAPFTPVASICVFAGAVPRVKKERRALALAMAAAPQMLEALQQMNRSLLACGSDGIFTQEAKLIRAAIAQAEGS